jgi:ornithine carbamoyltransferase
MQTFLHGRDLIGDLDFSKEEVETVLDVAFDLKRKRALKELTPYLRDRVLAMLFFFSSTRTRGSFEAGMAHLGGHAAFIESKTTQISHGDTPKRSVKSSVAISTASQSAMSIGALATVT